MKFDTFEQFNSEYQKLIKRMLSYSTDQAGSQVYAEKLGELVDCNPSEWEEMADELLV